MFNDVYGVVNLLLTNFGIISEKIPFRPLPDGLAGHHRRRCRKDNSFHGSADPGRVANDSGRTWYEAGAIDGATGIGELFFLTLPFIMPTLLVALIFRTLDALRLFDIFYIMVGGAGDMATMATYNRLQLIDFLDAGVGSATSVIILLFIMVFVILYTRISKTSFQ